MPLAASRALRANETWSVARWSHKAEGDSSERRRTSVGSGKRNLTSGFLSFGFPPFWRIGRRKPDVLIAKGWQGDGDSIVML